MTDRSTQQPIVDRIRARMAERGISQAELSRLSGIAGSHLSTYLAGRRYMRADTVERIAEALDCDLDLVPRQ